MTPPQPSPALHRPTVRGAPVRSPAVALLVLALLVGLLPAVGSGRAAAVDLEGLDLDEVDIEPEVVEGLDGARSRRSEVAAELDALVRSGVDLEARLGDLEAGIAAQEALVVESRAAADAALMDLQLLEVRVAAAEEEVRERQRRLEQRAVAAYMDAGTANLDLFYTSSDYNEYHERTLLMRQVADHDRTVLDAVIESKGLLADEQAAADETRAESERLADEAGRALDELVAARAEEELVRQALDLQIAAYRSEADALAAEEDALLALIAERASQPETPPTTAAPTTTAPATTTAPTTAPPTTGPSDPGPGPTTTTTTTTTTSPPPTTTPPPSVPGMPAMQWPHNGVVTSPFGWRWGRPHNGIDIGAWTGDPVRAAAAGKVIFSGDRGGYGYAVIIDHGSGIVTLYAHHSALLVDEGQSVSAGQTIGLAGSTGNSTGPHLHFEVIIGGVHRDPMLFLP